MWQRDNLFQKYCNETNPDRDELLHVIYKSPGNELTKKKGKQNKLLSVLFCRFQQSGKGSEW